MSYTNDDFKPLIENNGFFSSHNYVLRSQHQSNHKAKKNSFFDLNDTLDWINYINAYRRITLFSRLTWIKFWSIASQLHWLDDHNRLFGVTIHPDILSIPNDFYAGFGVAIYLIRLFINLYV